MSPGKDETWIYIEREKERERERKKERETERLRDLLNRLEFDNEEWLCRTNSPTYLFLQLIQHIQAAISNTSPELTIVFHARPDGRLKETKRNLRGKKHDRTNQDSNFLNDQFSNRDNVKAPIQFKSKRKSHYLKIPFLSASINQKTNCI